MQRRFIVRKFKNGVKHVWDTENNRCIHYTKVEPLMSKEDFNTLYKEFNSVPVRVKRAKHVNNDEMPKLIDLLDEVVNVYAANMSLAEIVGTLELCKSRLLVDH